jgi:methylmalonyl-CoA carboxyltransferase large subunit
MTTQDKIKNLREWKARLQAGGGEKGIAKQHDRGKMTARERIATLCEPETFQELFLFAKHRCVSFGMEKQEIPADAVVTGIGSVNGKPIHIGSQDFTVVGGAVGEMHADKICKTMEMALKAGTPFVMINDSGGARIQEGIDALNGYARIFYRNVLLSGVVPQISIISGPCAGGAAYSPALTDFIIMVNGVGRIFITGPQVIKQVTGEEVTDEELGGGIVQQQKSGVVHFTVESDEEALHLTQRLLSFLPSNNMEDPPNYGTGEVVYAEDPFLDTVIPDSPRESYDIKTIIYRILDDGDFLEVHELFAPNAVVGFGRVNGSTVGIVANQPMVFSGVIDIDASDKIARFVRFCNAFNIPLVTFVDVPGYMPGVQQEYGGIIRHGAKILFAYSAATVPKVTIILRKAYGGAYIAMCCKELGADRVAAWPTGETAVMGAEGAVNIVYRKDIEKAEDKQQARQEFINLYNEQFANPNIGAARNLIDDIIEPKDTRRYISLALETLRTKRDVRPQKKHGLIPM